MGTTAERVLKRSTRPLLVAVGMPSAQHRSTLLALDFDEASKAAGRAALAMGIFDHTDVVVMHAFDAPATGMMKRAMQPSTDIADYVELQRDTAGEDLRALVNELGLPSTCQTVVSLKGSPARSILEAAEKADSNLIVLGTNQRRGFERVLIGSVTADMCGTRCATCSSSPSTSLSEAAVSRTATLGRSTRGVPRPGPPR